METDSKATAVKVLKDKGYQVGLERNVVMVYWPDSDLPIEDVREILKSIDFQGSFGVKRKDKKVLNIDNEETDNKTNEEE